MASDVKWIKLSTAIFENRKVKAIRNQEDKNLGNSYALVWIMLLVLAGKCNNSGVVSISEKVPYNISLLSAELGCEEWVVSDALNLLEKYGLIEINEYGFIIICGWDKHQSEEKLEKIREQTKNRVEKHRNRQKTLAQSNAECNANCNAENALQVTQCNATDKEEDKDKEIDKYNYKSVLSFLNETCKTRFRLTEKTRRTIHARFEEGFTLEDFQTVIQKKFNEWNGTEFEKYLRPETLFGTKFERYLLEEERTNTNGQTEPDSFDAERLGTWL